MINNYNFKSEILVIGGGAAALFAAIKAKENGAEVIVVDKGSAGYSGQSPFAGAYMSFDGDDAEIKRRQDFNFARGEYVANKDYIELVYKKANDIFDDIGKYGSKSSNSDGRGMHRAVKVMEMPSDLRKHALKIGVKFVDKVMITDLLTKDKAVVGAVGVSAVEADFYTFSAKAVILCTGASALKPNGWPVHGLTGDGDAMAYRVGASIMGKEFTDGHTGAGENPQYLNNAQKYSNPRGGHGEPPHGMPPHGEPPHGIPPHGEPPHGIPPHGEPPHGMPPHGEPPHGMPPHGEPPHGMPPHGRPPHGRGPMPTNAYGEQVANIGTLFLSSEFEIHQGKGPVTAPPRPGSGFGHNGKSFEVGGVTAGMASHKTEGIVPVGVKGYTEITGLFAAGDAMATMQTGALYYPGEALAGSCVTGAETGICATEFIKTVDFAEIDNKEIEKIKSNIYEPLNRKGGYSPSWVIEQLQNLMIPYYITYIKKGDRLQATLTMLEFFSEHIAPLIKANDSHELRLAHEARNMILNSQIKLTASLARKESRGMHYREDYPFRDDKNFLCWVTVKKDEIGNMTTGKIDIPKEWLPEDFAEISYKDKYPVRILNEKML